LAVDKQKGETISLNDLEMLRPGDGLSPMRMNEVIGKAISKDLPAGHKLDLNDIV